MGHYVSFVIHSWQDGDGDGMRWSVQPVTDSMPIRLPNGSFLVRTWVDDEQVVRGLIRHVQSGREMQFQSGRSALEFVRSWIDDDACEMNVLGNEGARSIDAGSADGEREGHD